MTNEIFALEEPISSEKQVRKVLRSIPPRFESKVTAIEEARDLSVMWLDDLIGNLTTYEMKINSTEPAKKKGIALSVGYKEGDDEDLKETMSLLAKNFNKIMKRFNKKSFAGGDNSSGYDKRFDSGKRINKLIGGSGINGTQPQQNQQFQGKGIQCREYEGFRHIQVQCPNYIKK
ncbi:hypothetical protein LIER_33865 [Lithospermum erythrorhizon]|uniref:Uncharacterized protein n=1 Tax=Lithospermum erythrorhizon TaxID=34254 RepID=A0AAV3RZC5_LITER